MFAETGCAGTGPSCRPLRDRACSLSRRSGVLGTGRLLLNPIISAVHNLSIRSTYRNKVATTAGAEMGIEMTFRGMPRQAMRQELPGSATRWRCVTPPFDTAAQRRSFCGTPPPFLCSICLFWGKGGGEGGLPEFIFSPHRPSDRRSEESSQDQEEVSLLFSFSLSFFLRVSVCLAISPIFLPLLRLLCRAGASIFRLWLRPLWKEEHLSYKFLQSTKSWMES